MQRENLKIKRIYAAPARDDGFRVLVDRLWPRGVSKEKAKIDLWLKEIAPSNALRKWFSHKEERWEEFKKKYREELKDKRTLIEQLNSIKAKATVSLLFATKDLERNNAAVLRDLLR